MKRQKFLLFEFTHLQKLRQTHQYTQKVQCSEDKISDTKKLENKNSRIIHTKIHTNIIAVADQNHLRPKDLNSDARGKMRHPPGATEL
jgi:hypothetical protein